MRHVSFEGELRVLIRLLKKPKELKCWRKYEVEQYVVCITDGKYIVYDKITEEPNIDKEISTIEEQIKKMLLTEDKTPEEILEEIPKKYHNIVRRQFYSYGLLDPLFMDDDIIDIHIVYHPEIKHPIQVIHREYGRLETNIDLTLDEIREIVLRMASTAGKVISEAKPLHSFIEPIHEARISIVYHSDVTLRRSMTVDIRKQPKKPWTVLKLIDLGTLTPEEAAFLWLVIKYRVPILVVGELMSGKTTLINAIINLVPPDSRVLTIEDAPEIKVYTKFWTRTTTRESEVIPVTIFNILKVAMRISADYIVIGEIRGEEAREWAQAILLGHGGISSFHAQDPESAIVRLRTPPIEVNPQALQQINIIVKMIPLRTGTAQLIRRSEIYVFENDEFTRLFEYDGENDEIRLNGEVQDPMKFNFFDRVSIAHGVTREHLANEYENMIKVIKRTYQEAKASDPTLSNPDYMELAEILYRRLALYMAGITEEDVEKMKEQITRGVIEGVAIAKTLNLWENREETEVSTVRLDEIL